MPYIRSITFIFLIISLILPIVGVVYPTDFVTYVFLFALFIWFLALLNDFLSSLIALILSAFVTQRMLLLYIDPSAFEYQWVSISQITESALFCLTAAAGLLFGSLVFNLLFQNHKKSSYNKDDYLKTLNTFVGRVQTNDFVYMSSLLVIFGIVINLYFALAYGIGVGSEFADRSDIGSTLSTIEKIFTRLGPFFTYLMLFTLIVFIDDRFPVKTKKVAYFTTFLYVLFDIVILTSKGTFIFFAFTLLILHQLVNGYTSKTFLRKTAYIVILTVFTVFAGIQIIRPVISDFFINQGLNIDTLLYGVEYSFLDVVVKFSNRLAAFDWLAGIMAYPGDIFNYGGSLYHQLVATINSYTPGELIKEPEFVELAYAMPVYLDEQPIGTTTRELPGGLATMYLSFGWSSFFLYSFLMFFLRYIDYSKLHIFYKLIFFSNFTLRHFTGGLATFKYITDIIFGILIAVIIIRILRSLLIDLNRYLIAR